MNDFFETVRKAMYSDWDPIGVGDFSDEESEYDSYVPRLHELLRKNASESEVFDYLWTVEIDSIGLQGNREKTKRFAAKLCKLSGIEK